MLKHQILRVLLELLSELLFTKQEILGEFWTELPRIAQDILAIPATSVPSERLFSISGILSEDKRCNIFPENLERRVLLKANSYF